MEQNLLGELGDLAEKFTDRRPGFRTEQDKLDSRRRLLVLMQHQLAEDQNDLNDRRTDNERELREIRREVIRRRTQYVRQQKSRAREFLLQTQLIERMINESGTEPD